MDQQLASDTGDVNASISGSLIGSVDLSNSSEANQTPIKMDINQLLQQFMHITSQSYEESLEISYINIPQLKGHRMKPALFQVLCEIKDKSALNMGPSINDNPEETMKLDNMLVKEGVLSPDHNGQAAEASQNPEYREKLALVREVYRKHLKDYEDTHKNFTAQTALLLREQARIRPITPREIDRMVQIIGHKLSKIQVEIKNIICSIAFALRNRYCDARRKRRNFSKPAKQILDKYFYSHISNPYPSEEAKEELARLCDISVSQVSNWFGNKRIRYKRNVSRGEACMHAAAVAASQGGTDSD